MARGRKPLPTHIHLLRGKAGKRPLNFHEPKPPAAVPTPPQHLTKAARAEWFRVTKHLRALNLLTQLDRAVLAAYCDCYDRWVQATAMIQQHGLVLKMGGTLIQSPYVSISNKALEQMRAFMGELGLTPSSRTRIVAPRLDDVDDPNFAGPSNSK
jgi:P27 family predicted phage terminase small subunit